MKMLLFGLGAALVTVAGLRFVFQRAKRREKLLRRRKNIAYQRAWDWLMGRNKFRRLTGPMPQDDAAPPPC